LLLANIPLFTKVEGHLSNLNYLLSVHSLKVNKRKSQKGVSCLFTSSELMLNQASDDLYLYSPKKSSTLHNSTTSHLPVLLNSSSGDSAALQHTFYQGAYSAVSAVYFDLLDKR